MSHEGSLVLVTHVCSNNWRNLPKKTITSPSINSYERGKGEEERNQQESQLQSFLHYMQRNNHMILNWQLFKSNLQASCYENFGKLKYRICDWVISSNKKDLHYDYPPVYFVKYPDELRNMYELLMLFIWHLGLRKKWGKLTPLFQNHSSITRNKVQTWPVNLRMYVVS